MSDNYTITGWVKLGGLIRDARVNRGISQAELATRADVARSWLARVEAGHRNAELEPLLRLLTALDLSLSLNQGETVPRTPPVPRVAAQKRREAWGVRTKSATKGSSDG